MGKKKFKVYMIYGEIENTLGGPYLLAYAVGTNAKDAIENACESRPDLRDSGLDFSRKLVAGQLEVKGFKITAESLEKKVCSK